MQMKSSGRCLAALPLAIAIASPAIAQVNEVGSKANENAPTDPDIVVTAQFRASSLQRTPLAITALSGDDIEARNYTDIVQAASSAPSVTLAPGPGALGRTVTAFIRGVGAYDFNPAFDPSVGFYVDDVYFASLAGATFDLLDLERVETLRGPQGSLFGKNTIGGAIRLISRKPDENFGGSLALTAGSFKRRDARVSLNVPLTETFFARLSAVHREHEGYVDRLDFACANPGRAGSLVPVTSRSDCKVGTEGGENIDAARLALRFVPSDKLEFNLIGDFNSDRSEPPANVTIAQGGPAFDPVLGFVPFLNVLYSGQINPAVQVAPGVPVMPQMFGIGPAGLFGVPYDDRFMPPDRYTTYSSYDNRVPAAYAPLFRNAGLALEPFARTRTWGLSFSAEAEVAENVQLKSISGYRKLMQAFTVDLDGSPLPIGLQYNRVPFRQFSQELQLIGRDDSLNLDWVVGLYYFTARARYENVIDFPVAALLGIRSNHRFKVDDKSAFAHLKWGFADGFNLTAALRYTKERKDFHILQDNYRPDFLGGSQLIDVEPAGLSYEKWNPKISLDYQIAPTVMTYVQYSTGFRGGGINNRPFDPRQVFPVGPETLVAFEGGLKSSFFDRKVIVNLAAFTSRYRGIQTTVAGFDPGVGGQFVSNLNIGNARVRGIELEASLRPMAGLQFETAMNLLDSKITSTRLPDTLLIDPRTLPQVGARLQNAPKFKLFAAAQYQRDIGKASMTARFDVTHTSAIFFSPLNTLASLEGKWTVANAQLTFDLAPFSLSAKVENIFKVKYFKSRLDLLTNGLGSVAGVPGNPREWSLTLKYVFDS